MSHTPAQRKASERARKRAAGLVLFTAWVHHEDVPKASQYTQRMFRKRWPKGIEQ